MRPGPLAFSMVGAAAVAALMLSCSYQINRQASVYVIDGDTIAIGNERIRLNGIDAPEMPGHCRKGRACVPGSGEDSTATLRHALTMGSVIITERFKTDRYGRTVAQVTAGGYDLSCWQLAYGSARYIARWDELGRVRRTCGVFQ